MLTNLFTEIQKGNDLKNNLIAFRQELKELSDDPVLSEIVSQAAVFTSLLDNEDPKIRKNAVQILGEIKAVSETESIYRHYLTEETAYNKAAYIKSLARLDYKRFTSELMKRRDELTALEYSPEQKKHVIEELHELHELLRSDYPSHNFTGSELVNEFVLLTNRNFKKITMSELKGIPHKEFTAGVMVKTAQLDYVRNNVRTYSELLFIPDGIKLCSNDPLTAAEELINAGICDYISSRLDNPSAPVFFRTDYRAKEASKAADFSRKFSSELEFLSKWKLINSTGNYELEFRFIDTSDNKLVILLRFCMLRDTRFSYRSKTISSGLKPSTAALLMQLSKDYFINNAAVLDPFCGSGTMLVERDRLLPARILYGIDIFKEAIQAAHINIKAAGIDSKTELVTRDFFEFRHNYRFDEVITDMPFISEHKSSRDIEAIYSAFFKRIPGLLEADAKLFIYSRNRDFLRKYSLVAHFKILAEFEISKMEGTYFFILSSNQQ